MADRHWVGAVTSDDLSDTANWSATRGGAGGETVPSTSDTVYIEVGSVDITAGALACANLYFSAPINFGTEGGALNVECTTLMEIRGNRDFANMAIVTSTLPTLHYRVGSGTLTLNSGTTTNIYAGAAGSIVVNAAAVVGSSGAIKSGGCRIQIAYNATAITYLSMLGGYADGIARSMATLNVAPGAQARLTDAAAISTRAYIGGKLLHHSTGTIADIDVGNGARATSEGGAYPFTVTASAKGVGAYCFDDERNVTKSAATHGLGLFG